MDNLIRRALTTISVGLLLIVPVYLSILLLSKALSSIRRVLRPIIAVLPDWMRYESLLALLLLVIACFVVGALVQTRAGKAVSEKIERSVLSRIPGYSTFRGFTRGFIGEKSETSWRPALVDTDDHALMPAFVIEELPDGRYTVFVPSIPTTLAGSVFVYDRECVHLVDLPLPQAVRIVSSWGQGMKELVAAMHSATPN